MKSSPSPPPPSFKLTHEEKKRRDHVFKDALASCAIEGLHLSKQGQELVKELYRTCETSEEMVAEFKRRMKCNGE